MNKPQLTDDAIIQAIKVAPTDWKGRYQSATWCIRLRLENMEPRLAFPACAIRKYLRDMERRGLVTSVNEAGNNIIWTLTSEMTDE